MAGLMGFDPRLIEPLGELTSEERDLQIMNDGFERGTGGRRDNIVGGIIGALDAVRRIVPQNEQPQMSTLSGGDVVGLMPENYNALADRLQRQDIVTQQMADNRRKEALAEQEAREGRVIKLRDAQERRRQELAIERMKMQREDEKEARRRAFEIEKMQAPKIYPIGDGKVLESRMNPDGTVTTRAYAAPGAENLPKDASLALAWRQAEDGSWYQAYVPKEQGVVTDFGGRQDAMTPNEAIRFREELIADALRLEFPDENGNYRPLTRGEAEVIADSTMAGESPKMTNARLRQASQKPQEITPEKINSMVRAQFAVPKDNKISDSTSRKKVMDFLLSTGLMSPEKINQYADAQGLYDYNSFIPGVVGEQYYLPTSTPATPAASLQGVSNELTWDEKTGTFR